jgi:hypothetical protein
VSAGVAVSYDNDDDLSAVPRASPGYARWRVHGRRAFQATIDAARRATLVTTPSAALAERYRAAGAANVVEIENYLPASSPASVVAGTRAWSWDGSPG